MALTEELELDITGALSQIDSLGTALDQVTSEFKVGLADAVDVLQNVAVDVDASAVSTEIDSAVAGADTTIVVEADTSAVDPEINAAVAAADTSVKITPEIDTAAAQTATADLSGSLSGLTGAAGGASTSLSGVAAAGGSFVSSLAAAAPPVAAAVAAITVLSGATDLFFDSAVKAEAATLRFQTTFGPFAADIQQVNVGSLTTDLGALNRQLGSSTSETKQAAASIGEFGVSFGASQKEAALTAEQITVLAARAVALNPALGSVGEATDQLQKALLTGRAKALAPFQLGLSKTAIDAKAAEIALADGGREVTAFDKQTAGASLAVAKLGDRLQTDIAAGAKNPVLQIRSLSAEFNKVVTEIGKPLVAPVLEILRNFQPVAQSAAKVLGSVVGGFVPLVSGLLSGLAPVFTGVFGALGGIVSSLQPVFEGLGKVVGALGPLFGLIAIPFQLLAKAFTDNAGAFKFIGDVLGLIADGAKILLDGVLGGLTSLLGLNTGAAEKDADALKNVAGETITLATASTALAAVLGPAGDAFSKFVQTSTGFGKANVAGELAKIGVTTDVLQGQIAKGDAGLKEFTASGIKAGKIKLIDVGTGAELSAEKVAALHGNLGKYIHDNPDAVKSGEALLHSFRDLEISTDAAAASEIKALADTNSLSAGQLAGLPAQAQYTLGNSSMASQLQVLRAELALGEQALLAQQGSLAGNAAAFTNLTGQIASGQITQANAAESFRVMGLNADQAKLFFDAAKASVDSFVSGALSTIPTAADVFKTLADTTDPLAAFSLPANLKKQEDAVRAFSANLGLLAAGGFSNLQAQLAQAGPEATAAFVKQAAISGPEFVKTAEANAASLKTATEQANVQIADSLKTNTVVLADGAKAGTRAYGSNLDFAGVTKEKVAEAGGAITEANARVQEKATTAGKQTGGDFVGGIGAGIQGGTPGAVEAVRAMIQQLKGAADAEARAHSPSLLFAELGANISAGIAVGIAENTAAVVAEAEAIVAAAAAASLGAVEALQPAQLPAPLAPGPGGAPVGAAGGGLAVGPISVEINVSGSMSEAQAQTAGAAAADGLISQLQARRIDVAARQV